jgi:hypothetical protein
MRKDIVFNPRKGEVLMLSAEVKATMFGHEITATLINQSGGKAKLYIDGAVADTSDVPLVISNSVALVRGKLTHDGHDYVVEVYTTGSLLWKRINIFIDGRKIASSSGFLG